MELKLPKWICMELAQDSDKSIQHVIKQVLVEYLDTEEGGVIRGRIREREGIEGKEH